jgi:hypothetical protein
MPLPPPPPAVHQPAPQQQKPGKTAENYGQSNKQAAQRSTTRIPTDFKSGYLLQRYAKNPRDKRVKKTNRLRSRKQAKLRAKRKKA